MEWKQEPANGRISPVIKKDLVRFLPVLRRELKKYPPGVFKGKLKRIIIFNELKFYGIEYGGSYFGKNVYFTVKTEKDKYSNEYLQTLIHHEISSIFFWSHNSPVYKWADLNPAGTRYLDTNKKKLQAIEDGESEGADTYYKQGFLNKYGKTSVEEDFNLYAQMLFVNPEKLNVLAKRYPVIKKKKEFTEAFYLGISSQFFR